MELKYGIDIGHNNQFDIGALGYKNEDNLSRDVGEKVISKLTDLGYIVINCSPKSAVSLNNSLFQRVKTANENNVDVFVSIHFNAGGGNGTEAYAASSAGAKIAESVVREISVLGYNNRGIRDGSSLYVIRNTNAPAILIECAFVDSKHDMDIFNSENMASAIVKGLTEQNAYSGITLESKTHAGEISKKTNEAPSNNIIKVQNILNRLRIRDSNGENLVEDGILGEKTMSALKLFQGIAGINKTEAADKSTLNAFQAILNKPLLTTGTYNPIPVRYLQWRIGAPIDGSFGSITAQSLYRFQRRNSLIIDGVAGPKTWETLIG